MTHCLQKKRFPEQKTFHTCVKGTAAQLCSLMSLGLMCSATASLLRSLLCITFCHISRPCFLLASALLLLALTWGSRAAGLLWARADGPGRPRAKKAGNAPRLGEFLDGTWLPAARRRKWGLSLTTLTDPRTGSSGPFPEDSKSFATCRWKSRWKALRGNAPAKVTADNRIKRLIWKVIFAKISWSISQIDLAQEKCRLLNNLAVQGSVWSPCCRCGHEARADRLYTLSGFFHDRSSLLYYKCEYS